MLLLLLLLLPTHRSSPSRKVADLLLLQLQVVHNTLPVAWRGLLHLQGVQVQRACKMSTSTGVSSSSSSSSASAAERQQHTLQVY
jgi:hypothetical protein